MTKARRAVSLGIAVMFLNAAFVACGKKSDPLKNYSVRAITKGTQDFHSELMRDYLKDNYWNVENYAKGKVEKGKPDGIDFSWTLKSGAAFDHYTLYVSEQSDFSEVFTFETDETFQNVQNLKLGTKYYYKVVGHGDVEETSNVSSITTVSSAPRNLSIKGVTNARDLGGWKIDNKKRVKQGLLYRTGRYNQCDVDKVNATISEGGIETMVKDLKIHTEIDLRRTLAKNGTNEVGGLTDTSVLGASVQYIQIPMEYADMVASNKAEVKKFFETLGDETNYPIAFHCSVGTDRTGYLAFLVNGLLGVSSQDLYRDYLLSNFGYIGGTRDMNAITGYINKVKQYSGKTLSEQIENFLVSYCSVDQADVDFVKAYLTESV